MENPLLLHYLMLKYFKYDFQQIFKMVLEIRTHIAILVLMKSHKKFLKVRFLDLYQGKIYIKCYNFSQ